MDMKRYAVIDADTEKHVATVEAETEKQAIERFALVKTEIRYEKAPGTFWQVVEVSAEEPNTVPFFLNGYFLIREGSGSSKH